jgi:hypothetical protein
VITGRVGDNGTMLRRLAAEDPWEYIVVTDADHRPLGWLHRDRIPADTITAAQVEGTSPLMDRRTTLKDALSMLLEADVQAGLDTDRNGAVRGMIRLPDVVAWSRGQGMDALGSDAPETPGAPGTSGAPSSPGAPSAAT